MPTGALTGRLRLTVSAARLAPLPFLNPAQDGYHDTAAGQPAPMGDLHNTPRACPVDHGTGSRSQMWIEATSMVPW